MAVEKFFPAFRIIRIQRRTIGKNDSHGSQCFVTILRNAAAHAAGIISRNASDHGRMNRCRIRTDFSTERLKGGIGLGAEDTGLQAYGQGIFTDLYLFPVISQNQQHRIRKALTGQTGTGRPKSKRDTEIPAGL
jgi:hypothetical protein